MSALQVTCSRSVLPGRYHVRYGTDHLGYVQKITPTQWAAETADGRDLSSYPSRAEAISAVIVEARL